MNCERNPLHGPATWRVFSDILDMRTCANCANLAIEIQKGLGPVEGRMEIEPLNQDEPGTPPRVVRQ